MYTIIFKLHHECSQWHYITILLLPEISLDKSTNYSTYSKTPISVFNIHPPQNLSQQSLVLALFSALFQACLI